MDLCSEHSRQWAPERARGVGKAAFLTAAQGLDRHLRLAELSCRVCPQRPVAHTDLRLCQWHRGRWAKQQKEMGQGADFARWLAEQLPGPGYGSCLVAVCVNLADSPLRLFLARQRLPPRGQPRRCRATGGLVAPRRAVRPAGPHRILR